ncbi:MAG: hypothetical protein AB7R90_16905 [Reyranellaceae bacterium]
MPATVSRRSVLHKIARALRQRRFHRFLGRLPPVSAAVRIWRGLADRFSPAPEAGPSRFPALPAETVLAGLRGEGVWAGLLLPASCVAEISGFARQAPCRLPRDTGERFDFAAIRDGRTPAGSLAPIAEVEEIERCTAVAALARDAGLLEIARRYLGFRPRRVQPRLYWSPVGDLGSRQRHEGGQTVDFHFDIEASRSLYAFFYIEGGGRRSGAHVAIAGSHRRKPWRLALAPAFQSDAAVFAHYPRHRERVLEGGPGFGFLEDPGCYHKALPPLAGHRLVLQLRIS